MVYNRIYNIGFLGEFLMKQIRYIICFFSVLALMVISSSAYAAKTEFTAGILNDYEFSGNEISVYAKDCVQSVFEYTEDTEVYFTELNLTNSINAINNGNINFLCMVPWDDTLSAYFDYTSEPIATGFLTLFTNAESDIYFEDFKKFDKIKIGMLKDSYFESELKVYSAKNQFTYTPVYFNTINELTDAVNASAVDAIFVPSTVKPNGMRLIAKCGSFDYYCAVKKGNAEMLNILNSSINSLKTNSPFYLSTAYTEHFRIPYFNMAALTEDEYLALQDRKKLKILVPDDNYPMVYFDEEKLTYAGVYIEIIEKVAKNAGIEIEYVTNKYSDDMVMNNIVMGNADAILTVSGDTTGLITATEPYTSISYLPVAKTSTSIFEDSKLMVGILSDDEWITDYLNETHPQWTVEEFSSINSLLRAVENDKVQIILLSSPDMQTKTSLITHPRLSILNDFSIAVPVKLGISTQTCQEQVVNLLNKIIQSVSVPESEFESRVYTLSHIYVPNFRDMIYANKLWLIIILIAFITIVIVIKMRERYFRKLAQTDSLTKIHNKEYFNANAGRILEKNPEQPYLLASIDARNFKIINDRFGHIIGDQTLISIAAKIKDIFKDNGLYARSQGDSFLVLIEDTYDNRKLIETLEEMNVYIHNSSKYHVPIKIGVCPISKYNAEIGLSGYIDRANIAKSGTPNRNANYLRYFTEEMEDLLNTQNTIEIEMVQALQRGDFIVYYQPKYELSNDDIIGAEALVRWKHRERGIVPPGLFIPLFEKNGFIVDLDFYVYESVLKMLRNRIINNQSVVPVSMNVSRCHLGDNAFVPRLEALVHKYKVPKHLIEMEITESIFNQEDDSALSLIYSLKEHGFTISMDDFGSGYSSLNLLRKVPIDALKIDKEFIDNTDNSPRGQVIIEEIICMASKINVKTICEGVETQVQRDFLKKAGCNVVQGFFYSKPLPYSDFEKLLNSSN